MVYLTVRRIPRGIPLTQKIAPQAPFEPRLSYRASQNARPIAALDTKCQNRLSGQKLPGTVRGLPVSNPTERDTGRVRGVQHV
jgi:hypothetical protein